MHNYIKETTCRYKENCIQDLNNHAEHKTKSIQEDRHFKEVLLWDSE